MKEKLLHMRDKLNDISKRNRSIRLLKLYNKWSFDLTELDKRIENGSAEKVVQQIFTNFKSDISIVSPKMDDEETLYLSKKLTDLYRNVKSIEDESGVHDFYMGYPFLAGTMSDGTFFQAPLFLYPVRLEKNNTNQQKWILRKTEEEPQLNRTLFLAFKKVNNLTFSDEWLEEANNLAVKRDLKSWISWLAEFDRHISYEETGLVKLKEYKREDIPEVSNLTLLEHAVIGDFPQGGSSLVKDYEELIKKSEDNNLALAEELVDPKDKLIDQSMLGSGVEGKEDKIIKEQDQLYLLETDGSQEDILREARFQKGLVVHGPPGTGKSQVIVNLITDALHQNKKILVVCQKRAALDVIYQRLDSLQLASHTALIHDEKSDRKELYLALQQLLNHSQESFSQASQEFHDISTNIANQEALLSRISKGLFEHQKFGYRLYDLYGQAKQMDELHYYIDLSDSISQLNKTKLEDLLANLYTYAEWYEQFGKKDYPLKNRKSYAKLEIKDKLQMIETLKGVLERAKQSVEFINELNHEKITPAYTWMINNKLEKIYDDLDVEKRRTMQGIRLWIWTSFTGKAIVEELLLGSKFKGLNSPEWMKVRDGLIVMHKLANETTAMANEIDKLKSYIDNEEIGRIKERIAKGDIPYEELDKMLEYIHRDFDDVRQMDAFYEDSSDLSRTVINKLKDKGDIEALNDSSFSSLSEMWVDVVKNSTYIHWIDLIEKKYPEVQKISTNEFSRIRDIFAKALIDKREASKRYLRHQLSEMSMDVNSTNLRRIKELKHEVTKKSRIWPIRRLVEQFHNDGLFNLMPVWLASPETVSSIFPLEEGLFDLVIFDEASQCTVVRRIHSVDRGMQLVIAGDEKQLPPFNMFRAAANNQDDEAEYDIDESESLLNLAKRRFPEKILQWHYRSKSEELINFSNHAFYQGQIQIAPNVEPLKQPPKMLWRKVEGQWLNQCNEIEAIEVVAVLKQHLLQKPHQTLGIITFNAKQQDKILDVIDKKLQEDSEFNALYSQVMGKDLDERIFVKNIENVQGDERDVILFSIGYAKNEEGKIFNRFGMLNQQGGENRLNVAITRAKENIVVISSIEPEELNVSATANIGPRLLKSYLKYVKAVSGIQHDQIKSVINEITESVNTHIQENSTLQFDSPFEEQVYKQLTNLGYNVTTQVGMSGYRIDLAVVHPDDPQRYILGVECDGAMYHSSPSAKERDVYRQRFLESRGWNIDRIWSRNWWKNPSGEIERIDQRIKEIVKKDRIKQKVSL
ncbi:AAA domain-containing protein [Priestia megaterium]|uniref:AAA domain-containing protein n=1 Tax=Priestia megaterium TaxID=1404 RepID=UPI000C9B9816|nr:AAA domain-containing protein [Priestia megaterium]PNE05135.1 helicase [Priestia megaterium]